MGTLGLRRPHAMPCRPPAAATMVPCAMAPFMPWHALLLQHASTAFVAVFWIFMLPYLASLSHLPHTLPSHCGRTSPMRISAERRHRSIYSSTTISAVHIIWFVCIAVSCAVRWTCKQNVLANLQAACMPAGYRHTIERLTICLFPRSSSIC